MKTHTLQLHSILRHAIIAGLGISVDMDSDTFDDGLWFAEDEKTYTNEEMKVIIVKMNTKMDDITRAGNLTFMINHSKHDSMEFSDNDLKLIVRACKINYDFTRDTMFDEFLDNKVINEWNYEQIQENVDNLHDMSVKLKIIEQFLHHTKQIIK